MLDAFALKPVDLMHEQHLSGLISHMFMHGGWIHLIGNMYFLYVVGDNLEDVLGHRRFLAAYLQCGFAAAHIISAPSSSIYMVGEVVQLLAYLACIFCGLNRRALPLCSSFIKINYQQWPSLLFGY